jgi:hypothetical protein
MTPPLVYRSTSGPVSVSHSFPEFKPIVVRWKIIASPDIQDRFTNSLQEVLASMGANTTFYVENGVQIVEERKGRRFVVR